LAPQLKRGSLGSTSHDVLKPATTVDMGDLVTVFESSDIALFAIAKSTLDTAGIRYITQAEGLQDLFGWGRLVSGYNFVTGAPRIRVIAEDAARARDLLRDLHE